MLLWYGTNFSLNKAKRTRELIRVTLENQKILARIQAKQPQYSAKKWVRTTNYVIDRDSELAATIANILFNLDFTLDSSIRTPLNFYRKRNGWKLKSLWRVFESIPTIGISYKRPREGRNGTASELPEQLVLYNPNNQPVIKADILSFI